MEDQLLTFRQLIDPIDPSEFFESTYGKRAVHIPGPPDKFAEVFSWESLNDLLGMSTLWTDKSFELAMDGRLLPPEEFCYQNADRQGQRAMMPDVRRVRTLLRDGATLALDFVDLLSPGLRSVTQTLESVTGAQVCASLFCSWKATQGYGSHFDTQNVFACHISGTKTWRIYEGRAVNAAEYPGGNRASFSQEHHEKAKGRLVQEIEMTPGDLLYIPHGLYHDALSESDACLHVSFGAMHLVAQDFVQALVKDLSKDPLFREHLPHIDELETHGPYLRRLGERFRQIVSEPAIAVQLRDFLAKTAYERVADFNLPARDDAGRFRVRWRRKRLENANGGWHLVGENAVLALDDQDVPIAQWALARDHFSTRAFRQAFEERDSNDLAALLEKMQRAGLIERI